MFGKWLALAVGVFGLTGLAQAANIARFTPQGETIAVRQVTVRFSDPMTRFGDAKAASPFTVNCPAAGDGRWIDDKNWSFDFARDLPAGVACRFELVAGIKTLAGEALTGPARFEFSTGGPYIRDIRPWSGSRSIEEDQVFVLTLSGPATDESIRENAQCAISGVASQVPVQIITGNDRKSILEATLGKVPQSVPVGAETRESREARTVILRCAQVAGPKASLTLQWGPGIRMPNGIATTKPQRHQYGVRDVFSASMTCQRENAQAPCTPIQPIELIFTSGVPRQLAEGIRLKTPDGTRKPVFEKEDVGALMRVRFAPPFAENAELTFEIPGNLKDESGRALANTGLFPLKFRTNDAPPLAKFASGLFGVLELNANPALPITVRRIELPGATPAPTVRRLLIDDDVAIMQWLGQLRRMNSNDGPGTQDTRSQSLLKQARGVQTIALPPPKTEPRNDGGVASYPFEVVGLPFTAPGFYVNELESLQLGKSLLANPKPMFVRTSTLVTNLAVHLRMGRENSAVWVTTLDKAQAVKDARVHITDCNGTRVWEGVTDANGVAMVPTLEKASTCRGDGEDYSDNGDYEAPRYLISARSRDAQGRDDMAFVLSTWNQGIETWRFNLPTEWRNGAKRRGHAVLDRSLLRAGETVSMKLFLRTETLRGLALLPRERLPQTVKIVHVGSGQEFLADVTWPSNRYGTARFDVPKDAKLGAYQLSLDMARPLKTKGDSDSEPESVEVGGFRVEEFRLPTMTGRIQTMEKGVLAARRDIPVAVQLDYLNGGPAAGQSVRVSALLREKTPAFESYETFSFNSIAPSQGDEETEDGADANAQRLVANKLPLTLDKSGSGKLTLKDLPKQRRPASLVLEATYADANGELQTLSNTVTLWPAAVVVGLKVDDWVSVSKALNGQVLVLDTAGKPLADRSIEVTASLRNTLSYRKRLVGGFYAYDNQSDNKSLGTVCKGKTDARGLVFCEIKLEESGNVVLTASARDDGGNVATAFSSVWVTNKGEIWFDGENHDRMDLLPERRRYQPGETAKLQVRMPFRYATALVSIEREGVIEMRTVRLSGQDPTIEVPIKPGYGPNVFVSVLAVRERLREVPWYSLFQWGWKEPMNWWREYREYQAPTATVDLTKPAYKLGIAELTVGLAANELRVQVTPEKDSYAVRGQARVKVKVMMPDGAPLPAGTPVAFAAVDQALLELSPNRSWDLLAALMARRSYGMETYTAQMYVVGKRHFGRKAVPAGGGGGAGATRELFDTLLLWNPALVLDGNGEALVTVPLNDSLTSFALVAIADGLAPNDLPLFGTGRAMVRTTQDLQIVSGLPPLVRDGDSYRAGITLRNTTNRTMEVDVTAKASGHSDLLAQRIKLAANSAADVGWTVTPPGQMQAQWEISARELAAPNASDRVKVAQRIVASVPYTVQQATLMQLDKTVVLPVTAPADALPGKARIDVGLAASLAKPMPGVQRYFEEYPFICLEQKTSKAIGMRSGALWQSISQQLPLYLDGDGLAQYFPAREGWSNRGSDTLTSYVLAASHEAGFTVPKDSLDRMQAALAAFVEGRIQREFWSPSKDLDQRKLSAIEALSRRGAAQPAMLDSVRIQPTLWPTHSVIDWVSILRRMPQIADRDKKLAEAYNVLRSRLNLQGTRLGFSTEKSDYWWWLMASGDANAAKLVLAVMDDPQWRDDMGRLVNGTLQRQIRGAWLTTTANVWGSLAMEKFAKRFESDPVTGTTRAELSDELPKFHAWKLENGSLANGRLEFQLPEQGNAKLTVTQQGNGKPWLTISSLAAVQLQAPFSSGYRITKTITAIDPKVPGQFSRGDVLRVRLQIDAQTDMTWVVVSDPIPSGSTLLGSGLGRDSEIETRGEKREGWVWPAYEERTFDAFRSYYEYVPKGSFVVEYTVRLNTVGTFQLPPTRAEAMYAPEMFGEIPNAKVVVK
jgi:uncharacterized protein YfaS (alpha-2-macroglobulin family)